MKKFSTILEKFKFAVKQIFSQYPITLIIVIATTILFSILFDTSFATQTNVEKMLLFGLFTGLGTLFAETKYPKTIGMSKFIIMLVSALISYTFIYILFLKDAEALVDIVVRFVICYIAVLSCLILYYNIKNSKLELTQYATRVFWNLLKTGIIYFILAIGISLITFLFISLILDGLNYEFILRMEILIFGLFFIPFTIKSISDVTEDVGKFIKGLVVYVLLPMVAIAFVIIYIYIIKILAFRQIPSNQIFRILATLFILAFPIYFMSKNYKENKYINKILSIIPYAFIPFIILQIYAIGIRSLEYGLTINRYLSWVLVIFEILTIVAIKIKDGKYEKELLIALAVLSIVSTIVPGINMITLPLISQAEIVQKYTDKGLNNLSKKEKIRLSSAYEYIKEYDKQNKYNVNLQEGEKEIINQVKETPIYDDEYWTAYKTLDNIDISGYNELFEAKISYNKLDISKLAIIYNNKKVYLDMTDEIENYKQECKRGNSIEDYIQEHGTIIVDKNKVLYIQRISIKYDSYNDNIEDLYMQGILLVK